MSVIVIATLLLSVPTAIFIWDDWEPAANWRDENPSAVTAIPEEPVERKMVMWNFVIRIDKYALLRNDRAQATITLLRERGSDGRPQLGI